VTPNIPTIQTLPNAANDTSSLQSILVNFTKNFTIDVDDSNEEFVITIRPPEMIEPATAEAVKYLFQYLV
jgi:hypothetical protein